MKSIHVLWFTCFVGATFMPAQQARVVPAGAASRDGTTLSVYPFGYTTGRLQMVVASQALCTGSAVLTGIAFRRDEGSPATGFLARQIPSLTLSLSTTTVAAGAMSTTFGSNVTGTPTVVFRGAYNLPAQPNLSPAPFNIQWVWTAPFLLIRNQGNLLIDILTPGTPGKSNYFVDAETMGATTPGGALPFGTGGIFAGQDPYSVGCPDPLQLLPGGRLSFEAKGLSGNYPSLFALGSSRTAHGQLPLPFDLGPLGAPGNFLQVDLFTVLGLPLAQAGGSWSGTVALPVPADPWLAGLKLYGQAFFVDAASNPFGLVLSEGLDYTLGFQAPVMQLLGTFDSQNLTGNLANYGVVTQFTGAFN